MGTELLVASLWVAVLVYWLWTRRPTTADTVGLFRYELRALRQATPSRVAPANRVGPARPAPAVGLQGSAFVPAPAGRPLSDHLAAAAATHRKLVMRRRRRDVLCALGGAAGILLGLAALTGSTMVVGLQVMADIGLGGYVVMLSRTARAGSAAPAKARRPSSAARGPAQAARSRRRGGAEAPGLADMWAQDGDGRDPEPQAAADTLGYVQVPGPHLFDQAAYVDQVGRGRRSPAHPAPPVAAYARAADVEGFDGAYPPARTGTTGPVPESAMLALTGVERPGPLGRRRAHYGAAAPAPGGDRQAGSAAYGTEDEGVYGDFDSYASLALAN